MAAYGGCVNIKFAGNEESLALLNSHMKSVVIGKNLDSDDVNEWSFLEGYDCEKYEIESELIAYDTIDSVKTFVEELTEKLPNISFYGSASVVFLNTDGSSTQFVFAHVARTKSLWCSEKIESEDYEDFELDEDEEDYEREDGDDEGEATEWIWDAESKEKKYLEHSVEKLIYPLPQQDVGISLPCETSISGTEYEGRNARIENVHEGDSLILKADWESQYFWPVAIEVFDASGGSLGFLSGSNSDNRLVQIAKAIDSLEARVASVTPLSKRRKNAKYALLDVEIRKREF